MKYFSSDFHLSHKSVLDWSKRPFKIVEENNQYILDLILSTCKKGDDLYFLGDLSWRDNIYLKYFLSKLKFINFHWILGNHDDPSLELQKLCTTVSNMKEIKIQKNTTILCHFPMISWNKSHQNSFMLHGHHHIYGESTEELTQKATGKILNVNIELHNYKLWSEDEVIEYMSNRPDNWDYKTKNDSSLTNI